ARMPRQRVASLVVGARSSTDSSRNRRSALLLPAAMRAFERALPIHGNAAEYAVVLREWRADRHAAALQAELAQAVLVRAAPLLDHGQRAPDLAGRLEVAQRDDRVGEVARVDRRLHAAAEQALLRDHHHGHHTLLAEIGE